MTPLPIADWRAALAGMETALAATLAGLDRYQTGWEGLLGQPAPAGEEVESPLTRLQDRLTAWDDRLTAAGELAAAVEHQLASAETAVGRWQERFTGWREMVQQGVVAAETPG
ncbi:MAG: hypothetical protein JWO38_852 [Gemmataceae bacterium]|nr:hypothetical protein [Gemmataceae bacterium]